MTVGPAVMPIRDQSDAVLAAFSASYAEARARFLEAANRADLPVTSYPHPVPGRDGEPLAIDVALDGPPDARRLLLVTSGCHGVEGHCGSAVQVFALRDPAFRARRAAAGVAVLHLHALNPFGFSHGRRVTHEGVDLNRNFPDFTRPLPGNPAYVRLHPLVLPERWPPGPGNAAALGWYVATHGARSARLAVHGGQYERPDGLFYGGAAPSWSNRTLRQILRDHAGRARRLTWIDLHTGLGRPGRCQRGYAGRGDDAAALARAREWWGGQGATPVIDFGAGSPEASPLTGMMWRAAYDECPGAEITSIGLEFGTLPLWRVFQALRAEQWLANHPGAPALQAGRIRRDLRDAFYVDTPRWKAQVVEQAMQSLHQAVDGLRR